MARKSARGLLIRDEVIEIWELTPNREGYVVSGYAWSRLVEGVVKGGKVVKTKVLAEEIEKLMIASKAKAIGGPVVLGLPQSQAFVKVFSLPKFEEKELEEAINWHMESLAPMLPKERYSSYEIIGKSKEGKARILLVSVIKSVIDGYLEVMELAGVQVGSIEPLAISRARLIDPKMLLNKSVVGVHLHRGRLAVLILVNGKLWFSKESLLVGNKEEQVVPAVVELVKFFSEKKDKDVTGISEIIYSGDKEGIETLERNLKTTKLKLTKAGLGMVILKSSVMSEVSLVAAAPVLGLAMRGVVMQKGLIDLMPKWPKKKAELSRLIERMNKAVVMIGVVTWLTVVMLAGGQWWFRHKNSELTMRINV